MRFYICIFLFLHAIILQAQNPLFIPPTITGTVFNLQVQSGSKTFYGNTQTPTYGINGVWMCPTIIVNKGDSVTLNVINNLNVRTTMHWHGLHVSAINDGGPHQVINPSTTWSPSFKIRNEASTFWYHPHGHGQTELQVSKGLAGLFIVKDSSEAKLNIPRTYGKDDFPVIVQSKAFDELKQFAIASDMDTALFINGTINPYLHAPAQVIRLRLLNGSSLRSFNFGFSNNQAFYQIATDGGLLDSTKELKRLILSPGERAEILVNFTGMFGDTLYLQSFGSELPDGIYGSKNVGSGDDIIHEYEDNFLNGKDFNLLQLRLTSQTSNPISLVPQALIPLQPFDISSATVNRTVVMDTIRMLPLDVPNRAEGPFGMNNKSFDMDRVDDIVYLNTTEIWTLVNKTLIAHPFHIHDIQFNVIEKSGIRLDASENGWKDVVLVMPGDSVKFITRFTDFADNMTPYMYHCHLLHHEDDGMMGSFLVVDSNATDIRKSSKKQINIKYFPNPVQSELSIELPEEIGLSGIRIFNITGSEIPYKASGKNGLVTMDVSHLKEGMYFIQILLSSSLAPQKMHTLKFIKQ